MEQKQDSIWKVQTGTWIMQPKISIIMPLKQYTKESIHAVGLHKKSNNSNKKDVKQSKDKFIK